MSGSRSNHSPQQEHTANTRSAPVNTIRCHQRDLIDQLQSASGEVRVVNQIEWSPFGYSTDMLDYARKNDIVIQAYSPLTRANRLHDPRVVEIASKYDKSPAQLLIR